MKRIIENVLAKKEYILYPLIVILIGLYEYGTQDTLQIVIMLYAIIVPTILIADIYIAITKPKFKPSIRQVLYLVIGFAFLIGSYFMLEKDSLNMVVYLSIGLVVIFILITSIFKGYNSTPT